MSTWRFRSLAAERRRSERERARRAGRAFADLVRQQRAQGGVAAPHPFRCLRCRRCEATFTEMLALVQHDCVPAPEATA